MLTLSGQSNWKTSNKLQQKLFSTMLFYKDPLTPLFLENSCDDGEYGAGRKLLRFLQDNNIVNKIVIVTRWYGGKHMGQRRYECIMKVANEILHKDR